MIPFRDNIPSNRFPALTLALIGLNVLAFLYEARLSDMDREHLVHRFGVIPRAFAIIGNGPEPIPPEVMEGGVPTRFGPQPVREVFEYELDGTLAGAVIPLFASMFLHAGWAHLIGNMWFLWLFGDNVEDRLGRPRYLVLYILSGLAASATQVFFGWNGTVPMIGASGAIAGVLGAYMITYPYARVLTFVPFFYFFWPVVELPAFVFLGFWFLMQFFQGAASLVAAPTGGVARWAHVGGFLAGIVLMMWMAPEQAAPRGPRRTELVEEE